MPKTKRIVFFHPDLGIGGAERLVVDAAVGLQNLGHKVTIYTSHCDPQHCFDEARDGTLDVRVGGNTLVPASILARLSILCAILRQLHLILTTYLSNELSSSSSASSSSPSAPDAFFVDQLSAGLPLLRYLYPRTRILFYCHYPDLLLARGRARWWKRWYRVPFDRLEEWSMRFADVVAVNSRFTGGVVGVVWPGLVKETPLEVVYPCVDVGKKGGDMQKETGADEALVWKDRDIILSLNRFEEKKDVGLAIRAFAGLGKHGRKGIRLVIAGGYDNRVLENVTYHKALVQLSESLGLKCTTTKNLVTALGVPDDTDVLFLLSVPGSLKEALLKSARLLVYTPQNEHFGIVPLEAMLTGTPVLAANSGGPLETIVDGITGWLRSPDKVEEWTDVMNEALHKLSEANRQKMATAGRERVVKEFSDVKMAERLDGLIESMARRARRSSPGLMMVLSGLAVLPVLGIFSATALWRAYRT